MLHSHKVHLNLGLKHPVRILHFSDIHIAVADDIDGDGLKEHSAERRNVFFGLAGFPERSPIGYLEEAMEYSKNFDCTVITGDLFDFMTHGTGEEVKRILGGKDYMFCAGNHEFGSRVGEGDSFERKEANKVRMQAYFRGDIFFDSRIVGGVNIITMDNGYYTWTEDQFEKLKTEVAKGYPCLIFCHSPLNCLHMDHNPPHPDLGVSEKEVEFIRSVTDYIKEEPAIKAVFSGHYHMTAEEKFGDKINYIIDGLFKGVVEEIFID